MTKLSSENNKIRVCRRFLGLIGDLVIYHNRSLKILILTCQSNILNQLNGLDQEPSLSSDQEVSESTPTLNPFDKREEKEKKETTSAKTKEEEQRIKLTKLGWICEVAKDEEMINNFKKQIVDNSLIKLLVI